MFLPKSHCLHIKLLHQLYTGLEDNDANQPEPFDLAPRIIMGNEPSADSGKSIGKPAGEVAA